MTAPADGLWSRVSAYLDEALELDAIERESWLKRLESTAPELAAELRELLAIDAVNRASGFMERSPLADEEQFAGVRIGAYTIERLLGRGGMGSVWLGRRSDGKFDGQVAIKLLERRGLGAGAESHIRHEASLLARLTHPNIARLFDAGVRDNAQPYLILEYVAGEPIDRSCEAQRLSLVARLEILLPVLEAVAHAHAQLIVHRDLKPSNVLVTPDGRVKLLDFGIASLQRETAEQESLQPAMNAFTPGYAAPEQLLGEPVSAASDVYALGVLMHVLVTGQHPYGGAAVSAAELARATLTQDPAPASERISSAQARRRVRGDLDAIIAKALQRDPAQRYATAAELAADVRRFLANFPVAARTATRRYVAQKFARRHWGGILSAVLTLLALVGATAITSINMLEARRQRDLARSELHRAEAANDFSSLMLEEIGDGKQHVSRLELLNRAVQFLDARYGGDRAFVADMLTQIAARYADDERNDIAIRLSKQAVDIARQTQDPSLLVLTLCSAAHREVRGDTHPDVEDWLTEAGKLLTQLRDVPLRARTTCLRAQGEQAFAAGRLAEAATRLQEAHALQVAEGMGTGLDYTGVLSSLGKVYLEEGRYADAYLTALETGVAFDRGGRGGTLGRAIIHENVAATLLMMGEPRAALVELEAARRPAPGVTDGEPRLGLQGKVAWTLRRLGRLEEARVAVAGEADRLLAADAPRLGGLALIVEAEVLAELGQTEPARAELERAIGIVARHPHGGLQLSRAYADLSDLDTQTGRPAVARTRIESFLASQGYGRERNKVVLEPALMSAARAAFDLGDLPTARRYAEDARAIAERSARGDDTSADVGDALMALARVDHAEHRVSEARLLTERAVRCYSHALGADAPVTVAARDALRGLGT